MNKLEILLRLAGVLQLAILTASALVPGVLDWRRNLAPLHPFLRTLFWVYGAFIVLVISSFGILTLLNAGAMAAGQPVARSLAALIGLFWLARLAVQCFVFDCRDFLKNRFLALGYHCLTLAFIYLALVFGWAAMAGEGSMKTLFETGLLLAAFGQVCIAVLNLQLVRVMGWREPLERLPLLVREVFHVHAWFISITLLIFAAFTFRFAGAMALEPCRWVACSIGLFWAIRTVIQVVYYSGSHWHGVRGRTAVHIVLLAMYGGFTAVYLAAGVLG